jgi:PIN domain nuclease of toxin-antitoxin system
LRLLLDTHAFIWWLAGSERLPQSARRTIVDEANEKLVSAASAWEITTKHRLGRLPSAEAVALDVAGAIASQGFDELAITVDDAALAGSLPGSHRDPFDRMLIAQALVGNLVLVSNEPLFDQYGVRRLW